MNDALPFSLPDFAPGSVWLVGAGPGDPALLTLAALHALTAADVILYDALVEPRILDLARAEARRELAGKRAGAASPKQGEITARLIELARQGLRVLRLKGGDPFVFGRGPEEALGLVEAGIPFRVVPGITAGVAGLAYAGIPLTAKVTNAAAAFVTGHDDSGGLPDLDWESLARGAAVIVVYMPLRHVDDIARRLMAGGRSADEPVAIISKACTPAQKVLVSTLGSCAAEAQAAALDPPALMVVGETVRLRERLDWLDG